MKSQDVYVIRSIFSNKGKQSEGMEHSQLLRVQVRKDNKKENVRETFIRGKKENLYRLKWCHSGFCSRHSCCVPEVCSSGKTG